MRLDHQLKYPPGLIATQRLIIFLSLLICTPGYAQDASGTWRGFVRQGGKHPVSFLVAITINKDYEGQVIGTANYTRPDGSTASEHFDGFMDSLTVTITEKEVRTAKPLNSLWPLKLMHLKFHHDAKTGAETLSGPWEGVRVYDQQLYFELGVADQNGLIHTCDPGSVQLTRNVPVNQPQTAHAAAAANKPLPINIKRADAAVASVIPPPAAKHKPNDGYYQKTQVEQSRAMTYAPLREADVVFAKRIWREIDVREKMNRYLAAPRARLIDALLDAVNAGTLTAYSTQPTKDDPGGDNFTQPLTIEQANARLSDSTLVTIRDANNQIVNSKMVVQPLNPDSVVRFRIKEDWIFDRQRSVYEPRIIGIAPLLKLKPAVGIAADMIPAFWIYFPAARPILATKEIASNHNDATGLSFDDIFSKRMFASYIVKTSNNQDERVKDYAQGIDRLYESQRISKALTDWELDLWQY